MSLCRPRFYFLLLFLGLVWFQPLRANDAVRVTDNPLEGVLPSPALLEYAKAKDIPFDRIAVATTGALPRKGDRVTLLVTLFDGASRRQWLTCLEADDLTESEKKLKPVADDTLFTIAGRSYRYPRTRTALRISFHGPFPMNSPADASAFPAVTKREDRQLLSPEHLSFGLDGVCRIFPQVMRTAETAGLPHFQILASGNAFPSDKTATGAKLAEQASFSTADERIIVGALFPLTTFVETITRIPAAKEIFDEVIAKPSVWSVASHLGVRPFTNYPAGETNAISPDHTGLEAPVFRLPVKIFLNDQLALHSTLAVTEPLPPLQVCAGIIGVSAEHPTDKTKRLFIRVIASRRGP